MIWCDIIWHCPHKLHRIWCVIIWYVLILINRIWFDMTGTWIQSSCSRLCSYTPQHNSWRPPCSSSSWGWGWVWSRSRSWSWGWGWGWSPSRSWSWSSAWPVEFFPHHCLKELPARPANDQLWICSRHLITTRTSWDVGLLRHVQNLLTVVKLGKAVKKVIQ